MMSTIVTIIAALLIFSALVLIHELGHYTAARAFGVTVREFSIGMGPKLLSRESKKTGIVYSLRALPIGGFVSMAGEDETSDDVGALKNKPVWQRMIIIAAGAVMNLVLGIILMTVLVSVSNLGSTTIFRFARDDAPSMLSGLQLGDEIIRIGDVRVHTANDMVYEIMLNATEPIDVTVIRNGEKQVIPDVSFPTIIESGVKFGSVDFYVNSEAKSVGTVIKHSFYQSASSVKLIWRSLLDLVSGKYGIEAVSGPVGVTSAIGDAVKEGPTDLVYLCALIALNLGVMNLLPLPALDGGRFVFLLIELIRRKPIKPEYEGYVHFAGIVILMLFMVFVTYKDIVKLFVR